MIAAAKLKDFCADYGISCTVLATLADVGRSTAHNLLTGRATDAVLERAERSLLKTLPDFLKDKHELDTDTIDALVPDLFAQGDTDPMINEKIELTPAELKWFGLSRDAFKRDPEHFAEAYISPAIREIIDRLTDAIHYQGFVSVTGPIGAGKTILRRLLQHHVDQNPNLYIIWPESFNMKRVTDQMIAEAILREFNAKMPRGAVNRATAVKALLARLYKDGRRVVLAFDESHRLDDDTLSSLKNFLEMSSGGFQRYLGVILLGQESFDSRLAEAKFQEIVERVVQLKMPTFQPTALDYLKHRFSLINIDATALFDDEALGLICSQAETPLQLGNIANSALRISKREFGNKTVIGSAIKEKMFFKDLPQRVKKHTAK